MSVRCHACIAMWDACLTALFYMSAALRRLGLESWSLGGAGLQHIDPRSLGSLHIQQESIQLSWCGLRLMNDHTRNWWKPSLFLGKFLEMSWDMTGIEIDFLAANMSFAKFQHTSPLQKDLSIFSCHQNFKVSPLFHKSFQIDRFHAPCVANLKAG